VEAALADVERAMRRLRGFHRELVALEHLGGGDLLQLARALLRAGDERARPDGERLREYRDANLPALAQEVLSPAPIHPALERVLLGRALGRLVEELGPDHPAVRRALGQSSPQELADRAVEGTRLADPDVRRQLWDQGKAAVDASQDPMIALARSLDPAARAVRRTYEDEVEAAVRRAHEVLADARFALHGRSVYPDATFTPRLNVGVVRGWREDGRVVPPFTTLAGAFERATGKDPFALPPSWLAARPRLDLATRLNYVTDNDIVGGNSGSPVVNRRAELVGVMFDGNIHSLGGEYGFDPATNRAVAVHPAAVVEALDKVYGAKALLEELGVARARKP
jgi:Peptidase S46